MYWSTWRQPANRSKLSMQYTPSDHEDSDDEPLGNTQQKQQQQVLKERGHSQEQQSLQHQHTRFIAGQNVELNSSNSSAAESLRAAMSRIDNGQISPRPDTPLGEVVDTTSSSSMTKKLSLAKRISRFFGNTSSKSQGDTASSTKVDSTAASSTRPSTEIISSKKSISRHKKEKRFSTISRISTPTMEVIDEDGKPEQRSAKSQDTPDSVYTQHQRSHSTPEIFSSPVPDNNKTMDIPRASHRQTLVDLSRDRSTRDSGFDDSEPTIQQGKADSQQVGHRRYSSSNLPSTQHRPPSHLHRPPHLTRSRQSSVTDGDSSSSVDLLPYQLQQQQLDSLEANPESQKRTSRTPPSPRSVVGYEQRRRNTVTDGYSTTGVHPHQQHQRPSSRNGSGGMSEQGTSPLSQRRSSTPVGPPPPVQETLVSRIDREKSTVCFQAPANKSNTYTRDANLDPALSSLVQQHRQDYKVNQRLGGTGVPPPPAPAQYPQHQFHGSPVLMESFLPSGQSRDFRQGAPRRDSNGSQSSGYSPHQHPLNTSNITPAPSAPGTPGLFPLESGSGLQSNSLPISHMKRLSASQLGQTQHPYPSGHTGYFSGSDGNLFYSQSPAKVSPQLQPQGTQFNSQGRQRTAPK
ncbi:hypothetical protein BG004_001653, partial [Podila humilis]